MQVMASSVLERDHFYASWTSTSLDHIPPLCSMHSHEELADRYNIRMYVIPATWHTAREFDIRTRMYVTDCNQGKGGIFFAMARYES